MLVTSPIRSALVIAPHADDEAVGAGGLIAKLAKSNASVKVIFVAVDGFHHYGIDRDTTLDERKKEIKHVASILSFQYEIVYEGKDLIEKLDTISQRDLVDLFETKFNEHRPDLVLLPHGVDFDQDHIACFKAAFAAARPIPEQLGKHFPKKILTYESPKLVWSERPFHPTMYWDITTELEVKLQAVSAYKTQLRAPPHVRSLENIRNLAKLRGSEAGIEFAEAYSILRWIE
jgi:LmbE family N-acetylglucosaminyl deacetylase